MHGFHLPSSPDKHPLPCQISESGTFKLGTFFHCLLYGHKSVTAILCNSVDYLREALRYWYFLCLGPLFAFSIPRIPISPFFVLSGAHGHSKGCPGKRLDNRAGLPGNVICRLRLGVIQRENLSRAHLFLAEKCIPNTSKD
jgi:hypothetical protein